MSDCTVLIVDDSRLVNDVVRDVLRAANFTVIQTFNGDEALTLLSQRQVDLIILDIIMPGADGYEILSRIRSDPERARLPVMLLTTKGGVDEKVAGFAAGADDYVVKPFEPADLIARVKGLLARPHGHVRPAEEEITEGSSAALSKSMTAGKIVTVFSLKGGVGTTAIAVNLAVSLQQLWDEPTAAVDLDLECGSLNILLDILPTSSFEDLAKQNGKLNAELAAQYLLRHSSGVSLLAAPPSPERAETIGASTVEQTLRLLKDRFDYVVVDTASNFSEHTLVALEMADTIILPVIAEMSSVRAASTTLDVFHALNIPDERVFPVLNEIVAKVGLTRKQVETGLRRPVAFIPSASGKLTDSINQGTPLVLQEPDQPTAIGIEDLAYMVSRPESKGRPRTSPSPLLLKARKRAK